MAPKSKHKSKSKKAKGAKENEGSKEQEPPKVINETTGSRTAAAPQEPLEPKEQNVTPEFLAAVDDYYTSFDHFNSLVTSTNAWSSIPEQPMSQCPKQPLEEPWYETELEEQMQAGGFPYEEGEKDGSEMESLGARFKRLKLEEEEKKKKQKKSEEQREGKEAVNREIIIDVDKMIDAWTGKKGLIVPAGLRFPK
ncbi:uncharacterized protein KY384_002024 [Bacidia gigantensis]|uniref:uncharacterized protein n=1 Tax=Bacidia gigantensis TaxID=2732470 RepID=UPI001D049A8D|nr:uncharacterized protein KY384_002024 [Bacidia gigantensis]KAG8533241.1 hypothetical protein KY384_002024 [Bacidia gigantensis]